MAVRLFEYGGPEQLVFGEYDLQTLGAHDVLVKNFAGSVSLDLVGRIVVLPWG